MRFITRTTIPFLLCLCFLSALFVPTFGQSGDRETRAAQWEACKLADGAFIQHADLPHGLTFWRPAGWKEVKDTDGSLQFMAGDNKASVMVITEDIPEGYGIASYTTATLQQLRQQQVNLDNLIVRKVMISGMEGREIMLELETGNDEIVRETFWLTAVGPRAYGFVFTARPEHYEQFEPYFKRMILTARIYGDGKSSGHWDENYAGMRRLFDGSRKEPSDQSASPAPEVEIALLANAIRAAHPQPSTIERLSVLLGHAPDAVLDLLTDPDAQVRVAAIRAFGNSADPFAPNALAWAMRDRDAYCGAVAARALAAMVSDSGPLSMTFVKNALPILVESPDVILNLGAALSDERARMLAEELLNRDDSKAQKAGLYLAATLPLRGLQLPYARLLDSIEAAHLLLTTDAIMQRHTAQTVPELLQLIGTEAEYGAAQVLGELATAEALPVLERREQEIGTKFAATISRNKRLTKTSGTKRGKGTTRYSRPVPPPPPPAPGSFNGGVPGGVVVNAGDSVSTEFRKLPEDVRLGLTQNALLNAIAKIRLRDRYNRAKDETERSAVLAEARNSSTLSDWAEHALRPLATVTPDSALTFDAAKFSHAPTTGETLLPKDAVLYVMVPDLAQTLTRLDAALSGVQMETVRDQMMFAFLLNMLKGQMTLSLDAQAADNLSAALGLDLQAPLAMAEWKAAPDGAQPVWHSAVVVRTTDRARLERLLGLYQKRIGSFDYFVTGSSIAARFAGILPAAVPLFLASGFSNSSAGLSTGTRPSRRSGPSAVYYRQDSVGNLPVTVIEKITASYADVVEREAMHVAYLGDTALITPSRAALVDLLRQAATGNTIAQSAGFNQARKETGEVVFFSQLSQLYRASINKGTEAEDVLVEAVTKALGAESGALQLSQKSWETIFHLNLQGNEWMKSFRPFAAKDLTVPSRLLPDSTVLYAGAVFDPPQLYAALKSLEPMPTATKTTAKKEAAKAVRDRRFAEELAQRLVPHLHGEAAFALLNLAPALESGFDTLPAMAFALRLKDAEPARLFQARKLFTDVQYVTGQTVLGVPVAKLSIVSDELFFTVTDDYLILADSAATLKLLEAKKKFATTRDFIRSTENLPNELALFVTYSIDAAFAEARQIAREDEASQRFLSVVSALVHAFHSQRAFVALTPASSDDQVALAGRIAVSFDREGRYSVGNAGPKPGEFDVANALIAPKGLNILQPTRLESMQLRVTAKQPGIVTRVHDDISKFAWQKADNLHEKVLTFTATARHIPDDLTIKLPVKEAALAPYLTATGSINSTAPQVVQLAEQIAGTDRDGHSVARKLGEWTYNNLKWKKVESSTVETLASREADCLEHAELYVALARSLGLPARVVTGAAYGGGSFGAHAWVEIYLGKWVEVDPTWGLMDYVDATHLRFADDSFVQYAMLGQLELEVVETRATVADFQRDPVQLVRAFAATESAATRALVFDLSLAAERMLGADGLAKLNDKQRAAVMRAFERATSAVSLEWMETWDENPSILSSEVKDNRATILAVFGAGLLRLHLAARDGAWYITEVENVDEASHMIGDPMRGVLNPTTSRQAITRLQYAPERALRQLEQAVAAEGESPALLLLKADILRTKQFRENLERAKASAAESAENPVADKTVPAPDQPVTKSAAAQPSPDTDLLQQITIRWPDYAPAWYVLAGRYERDATLREKAVAAYQRYAQLMPPDPRPWQHLGDLHEEADRLGEAEAAYREAIARDRDNYARHVALAAFQFNHKQADKAAASLNIAFTSGANADEVFDAFFAATRLYDYVAEAPDKENCQRYENFMHGFEKQLSASRTGLSRLSTVQEWQGNVDLALKTMQRVLALGPEPEDHIRVSELHRSAGQFMQALAAADAALKLDEENAEAHFERACSLAQLNRRSEAIAALKRAIELDEEWAWGIENEEDLKPLTDMPEFKARLPKADADQKKVPSPPASKPGNL